MFYFAEMQVSKHSVTKSFTIKFRIDSRKEHALYIKDLLKSNFSCWQQVSFGLHISYIIIFMVVLSVNRLLVIAITSMKYTEITPNPKCIR